MLFKAQFALCLSSKDMTRVNLPLVAFGGAGPTHSCEVADELSIQTVIVPPFPGLTSALGLLTAEVSHDSVQMISEPVSRLEVSRLRSAFEIIDQQVLQRLQVDGVPKVE